MSTTRHVCRRRYKESAHLHATHDAEALKAADGSQARGQLSERVVVRLQAGAYLSLCRHLRARSDEVQNMDLMTVGGFCRNCLAKVRLISALLVQLHVLAWVVLTRIAPN